MTSNQLEQFDIRKFADRLTPKKGKNRYVCPVCEGTLTIDEKSGKYNCWGSDCPKPDIREAIRPLEEALKDAGITDNYTPKPHQVPTPKVQPVPVPIPAGEIILGKLPAPITPPPRIQKGNNIEIVYPYSSTQWVLRIERPDGTKITVPKHIDPQGNIITGKGSEFWQPYQYAELLQNAKGQWVSLHEGEKCVDIARFVLQLICFTFQGSCWTEPLLIQFFQFLKDIGVTGVISWPDHDKAGYAKAAKCAQAAAAIGLPFIIINPTRLWPECPEGGDIADWIQQQQHSPQQLLDLLHHEIQLAVDDTRPNFNPTILFLLAFWHVCVENIQVIDVPSPQWQMWRRSRSFTPNVVIHKRHFSFPLPQPGTIFCIKSGTGTGKTHWLINSLIKHYSSCGFLSLGYRNSLLLQFCSQLKDWYHLQQDLKGTDDAILIADLESKIAACLDSLLFFHPQDFNGRILILDELESIIYHLFYSNTSISKYRDKIITLFIEALNRASLVICLDGHLSDITVNFIQSLLTSPKNIVKIENLYQGNKGQVRFLTGVSDNGKIRANDYSSIIHSIKNHPGNFTIVSDSQRQIEALDKILTNQCRKTLRFDSSTSHQPWVKEFLANPPQYLINHHIEVLLYSPSSEAGLNIDIKSYFSDIYVIFLGVITTKAQLQMISRIRDSAAIISIFCKTMGFPSGRIHKSAASAEQLAKLVTEYVIECGQASLSGLDQEEVAVEMVKKLVANSANPLFKHECDLAWQEEFERNNLRACLREALLDSGYDVEDVIGEKSCLKQLKQTVQSVLIDKAEIIANSEAITYSEVQSICGNIAATPEDKAKVIKFRLQERLPGIEFATYPVTVETQTEEGITHEIVHKPVFDSNFVKKVIYDSPQLIHQMETRFLVQNPDIAKELQQIKWHQKLEIFTDPDRPESERLINLHAYKSQWLRVQALLDMGISHFLEPGVQWSAESPEVIDFYQRGKTRYKHTGLTVGKSKPCEFLGRALKSLGFKTQSNYQHKMRLYQIQEDSPIYSAIYESVSRRILSRLSELKPKVNWFTTLEQREKEGSKEEAAAVSDKTSEINSEQGIQAQHLPHNCYINIVEGLLTPATVEIDLVLGSREFIREALADNLLDWGALQTYFANVDDGIKQAVWTQFTPIEQQQLRNLQPTSKAEEFAKLFLDTIKSQPDSSSLGDLFTDANQLLALLDGEQRQIFMDCLPRKYHSDIFHFQPSS